MPATTLAEEVKLAGRYAYVRELGRGATGRVMLVADLAEGGAWRAAKVVPAAEAERLGWELEALARVSHPGLARVFELLRLDAPVGGAFALEAGVALLIEEHVAGKSASEALEALRGGEEALRAARVCAIGEAVASALAALHAVGLVHGDVKPANVLVPTRAASPRVRHTGARAPAARLIDLGSARPPGTSGTVSGTPTYLAPEAWFGVCGVATDLYALGVTLRQLLGAGATSAELPSWVPPPLAHVVTALLSVDPGARPTSAREVAAQLATVGASLDVGERDSGRADRLGEALFAHEATDAERAMAMESLPFVGGEPAVRELVEALATPGVVVVHGPCGAGRSRLVREAVWRVQRARVTAGLRAPTYSRARSVPLAALAYDAIVHVVEDASDGPPQAAALVRAAGVDGTALVVVLEMREAPAASADVRSIAVERLAQGEVRTLLSAALGTSAAGKARVSPAVVEAAISVSGGLAGRLCQLLAAAYARGADPARAATWRALVQVGDEQEIPALTAPAQVLAQALAVVGGALEARVAAQLPGVGDVGASARALMSAGLASVGANGRLVLRGDRVRTFVGTLSEARRRALAGAVLVAGPRDDVARGLAEVACGRSDEGERLLLSAIDAARRRGQPEVAAEIAAQALGVLGARGALVRASADALRALGRYALARAQLDAEVEPQSLALRAEVARLMGDARAARVDADRVLRDPDGEPSVVAGARALVARLALDAGDVDGAVADAALVVRTADVGASTAVARARGGEVLALAALGRGDVLAAQHAIDGALAAARDAEDRPSMARGAALLAALAHGRGETRVAAVEAGRAFELAEAAGEAHAAASFRVNVGVARLDLGELGPAIEALRDGARRLARLGRDSDAARAVYNLGNAAYLAGDDDLARVALSRAVAFAGRDESVIALAGVVHSDLARRHGDLREARAALGVRDVATLSATTRAVVAARRALIAGLAGDDAECRDALLESQRAAEESDTVPARAEPALVRVALALAHGEPARAFELARSAHELVRGASYELRLRVALLAAEAATGAEDDAAAGLLLAEARSLLDEAAATLPASARAALRAVPEHLPALAAPVAPVEGALRRDGGEGARWRRLAGLAKRLTAERTTARLAGVVLDAALELSGAERALLVARESDGSLRVRAFRGLARRAEGGEAPGFSRSIAARVLDDATPLATVDALADGRLDAAASVHALALRSVVAVPVRLGDDAAGVLYLDDRLRAGAFGPEDVALLVDLADLASLALANAESLRREQRGARRLERLRRQLAKTVERQGLELVTLRRAGAVEPLAGLVGGSESMRRVAELVSRVAASDVPVLVLGESGVGKELVARAVHDLSARRSGPFISENCGAIPEPLLESALFGHVRGAFTGADRVRQGLFEAADGGTLLLDEIGEMSAGMQTKLLRVLQDGEVRAVGGERTRKVDVRVLAATHRDLDAMVQSGAFRQDLYYRLAVMTISVPPLRARVEDIGPLIAHFVQKYAQGRDVRIDRGALALLQAYPWPGNVRQLENEVQRALVMEATPASRGGGPSEGAAAPPSDRLHLISPEYLSPAVLGTAGELGSASEPIDALDLRGQTEALEQRIIRRALVEHRTQTAAAKALGVSRFGLQKMLKRLGITP